MNRLDAYSAGSRKNRRIAAAIRFSIIAVLAICVIAVVVRIRSMGFQLAEEGVEEEIQYLDSMVDLTPVLGSRWTTVLNGLKEKDMPESWDPPETSRLIPDIDGTNEPEPVVTEPVTEDLKTSWKGNIVTYDSAGDVYLYGEPMGVHNGIVADALTGKTGGILSAREEVPNSYFADALFIGNSLAVGLEKSGELQAGFSANIGLNVRTFFTQKFISNRDGTELLTAVEAYARAGGPDRVYLVFGINELGWNSARAFTAQYQDVINAILAVNPNAIIYLQGILPVNEEMCRAGGQYDTSYVNNKRITEFNAAIVSLAEQKGVFYLNPGELLADTSGQLPAENTFDGIHLKGTALTVWVNYLKSHAVVPG
ncbi:MAG: hypothetical protein J5938_01805 [Clostridia bacterium]|nr:hypothetical protein [Clostridia bacterium]